MCCSGSFAFRQKVSETKRLVTIRNAFLSHFSLTAAPMTPQFLSAPPLCFRTTGSPVARIAAFKDRDNCRRLLRASNAFETTKSKSM